MPLVTLQLPNPNSSNLSQFLQIAGTISFIQNPTDKSHNSPKPPRLQPQQDLDRSHRVPAVGLVRVARVHPQELHQGGRGVQQL